MSLFQIPLTNQVLLYSQIQGLDGTKYNIAFRYNSRNDTWYMTIADTNNNILIRSMPCLTNVIEMTNRLGSEPSVFPIGELIFLDITTDAIADLDCTEENFGQAVQLFYLNAVDDEG